ncbi:tetratricopeptide repeat protein [Novosphingobium sp. BL-8A]|uniref:hypothetical protein n=1 Tax=Novosphingobium sp. BL-8A TaxID=3127639 RepID=UPI0037571739
MAALLLLPLTPAAAQTAEPSIDQIHALAAGGHVDQALAKMTEVLKQHPESPKAHYVEAELYARENHMAQGRSELARAEQLAPGLPFADVYSVAELNRQLALGPTSPVAAGMVATGTVAPRAAGFHLPWGMILAVGAAAIGLFLMFRRRAAPIGPSVAQGPWGGQGIGQGYGMPGAGMPGAGMTSGGMMGGSGLLGTLASGAAMGAGFAAGEEVVDRLFGSGERREGQGGSQIGGQFGGQFGEGGFGADPGNINQDMGGNDFGISDDGSWDDSSTDSGGW